MLSSEEVKELKLKGTQFAYLVVCERKLWLFSKGISMEHTSERVALGKVLDEFYFRDREGITDENVSIDFFTTQEGVIVHEVKTSSSLEPAHELQVKYYLYYLKNKGVPVLKGIIHYPKARKVKEVFLREEDEKLIEEGIHRIDEVISRESAPPLEKKPYCTKCAYYEFCYG